MKSRKNTINGKVIVTGDVNELEPNEVLINEKLNEDGTIQLDIKEIGEDGSVKELASGDKESNDSWGTFLISNLGGTFNLIVLEENQSLVANSMVPSAAAHIGRDFNIVENPTYNSYFIREGNVVDLYTPPYGSEALFKIIPEKEIKVLFLYDGSYQGSVPAKWDGKTSISEHTALAVAKTNWNSLTSIQISDASGKELLTVNFG